MIIIAFFHELFDKILCTDLLRYNRKRAAMIIMKTLRMTSQRCAGTAA